jgi:hypothetical protein
MDEDERERRRRRNEEERAYLADLATEDAAINAVRAARSYVAEYLPEPSSMQHFGHVSLPLGSSEPMRRYRAEQEELAAERQALAAKQERERQAWQRQAAQRAAKSEMTDEWTEAIGAAMAEYVGKKIDKLRDEVTTPANTTSTVGRASDLPVIRKIRIA